MTCGGCDASAFLSALLLQAANTCLAWAPSHAAPAGGSLPLAGLELPAARQACTRQGLVGTVKKEDLDAYVKKL